MGEVSMLEEAAAQAMLVTSALSLTANLPGLDGDLQSQVEDMLGRIDSFTGKASKT